MVGKKKLTDKLDDDIQETKKDMLKTNRKMLRGIIGKSHRMANQTRVFQ